MKEFMELNLSALDIINTLLTIEVLADFILTISKKLENKIHVR